jgi:phosphoserine phosphatase RsbU/P
MQGLMTIFPAAERGFVVVIEPEGRPRVRAVRQRRGPGRAPVLSRTIWEHVAQECRAVLIRDTTIDSRFKRAKSLIATVRTALCVPLVGQDGEPLGMVQLDRSDGKGGFKPGDLDLLAALSVPVGVAVYYARRWPERSREPQWLARRSGQPSATIPPDGRSLMTSRSSASGDIGSGRTARIRVRTRTNASGRTRWTPASGRDVHPNLGREFAA